LSKNLPPVPVILSPSSFVILSEAKNLPFSLPWREGVRVRGKISFSAHPELVEESKTFLFVILSEAKNLPFSLPWRERVKGRGKNLFPPLILSLSKNPKPSYLSF
jgi:hypothetical protein